MRGTGKLLIGLVAAAAFSAAKAEATAPWESRAGGEKGGTVSGAGATVRPSLPPRLSLQGEVEDYASYFSHRTLRRPLKGGQIDLQPRDRRLGGRHSLHLLSGAVAPEQQNADAGDDLYHGASWLFEHPWLGRFLINGVHNHRDANDVTGQSARNQGVLSLAGECGFDAFGQRLAIEAEAAHFMGDYDVNGSTVDDNSGSGFFARAHGTSTARPLTYSLRLEDVDSDFRPHGSTVAANRQLAEMRTGWRFGGGLGLEARLQDISHGRAGQGDLERRISGLTLSGPLFSETAPAVRGRLDAFLEDQQQDNVIDRTTSGMSFDLSAPPVLDWSPRLRLHVASTEDAVADAEILRREVNLSAGRSVSVFGLDGRLAPGLLVRSLDGGDGAGLDLGPNLSLSLHDGPHEVSASYEFLQQDRRAGDLLEIDGHAPSLSYRYQSGAYSFGLEADYSSRDPVTTEDDYRVGLFWRIEFSNPAEDDGGSAAAPASSLAAAPAPPSSRPGGGAAGQESRRTGDDKSSGEVQHAGSPGPKRLRTGGCDRPGRREGRA